MRDDGAGTLTAECEWERRRWIESRAEVAVEKLATRMRVNTYEERHGRVGRSQIAAM